MKLEIPGVPFTHDGDKDRGSAQNNMRRVNILKKFIDMDISGLRTLDIGSENYIGRGLGIKDATIGNLNSRVIPVNSETGRDRTRGYKYDFILCSEILEHLINPGEVMEQIFYILKPGGICVVATPIQYAFFSMPYSAQKHFVEYRPERLRILFEYTGFEIVKYDTYNIWKKWPFMFTGIRPFLRCLFHRSQLWMLRKPF